MNLGSCREVVQDGQTGFLVNNVQEAVGALERLAEIDRTACRKRVDECFSIETLVYQTSKRESWILTPRADSSFSNCVTAFDISVSPGTTTAQVRFSRNSLVMMRHPSSSLGVVPPI
ncbi:MAG: hypothetical protein JWP08_1079 [Bryobacterales bacterium]|nr:hypothetical protein [Bryobacterales bacterium]